MAGVPRILSQITLILTKLRHAKRHCIFTSILLVQVSAEHVIHAVLVQLIQSVIFWQIIHTLVSSV